MFTAAELKAAEILDSLIREPAEELDGLNWHSIWAGTGDGTPTGWTQSEGEANATARWWSYGFPAAAFMGITFAEPFSEGQSLKIALMDDRAGNAVVLKLFWNSAEQYFYALYEEIAGKEVEPLIASGFVPRTKGDRFYLSVEEGANGVRAWRETGEGEPEAFAEGTLTKSLEADYGVTLSLYLEGEGTFRGTNFTAVSLNPETPPVEKPTGKMLVALNGGGYGSTEPGDIAGAAHMVRFDTEVHSVANLEEMLATGLLIHALFPGPYSEAGVSAIEPDEWVKEVLEYYEANLTPAEAPIVEILNEPHGSWFWGEEAQSAANQAAYRVLVEKAYAAFYEKYGDEAPKIIASIENFDLWWEPQCVEFCDGVVVHPYGGADEEERESSAEGNRELVEQARATVGNLVPVYVTEVGWPTAIEEEPTGDSLQWTEEEQAANITSFYNWARATGYIAEVAYFQYHDYGTKEWYGVAKGPEGPYEHKPGYAALRAQAFSPEATTLPATGRTPTKATFNGTVNPNSLSTDYWFEYWREDWQTAGAASRANLVNNPYYADSLELFAQINANVTLEDLSYSEAWSEVGKRSVHWKVVCNESTGYGQFRLVNDGESHSWIPVTPGQTVTVTIWFNLISAPEARRPFIATNLQEEGKYKNTQKGARATSNGVGSLSQTFEVPAGITHIDPRFGNWEEMQAGDEVEFYVDRCLVEVAEAEGSYFPRPHELESGQAVENEDGTYTMATPSYAPANQEGDAGEGSEAVAVSEQVEGLEYKARYHFRLYASNEEGEAWGGDETFETLAAPKAIRRALPDLALDLEIETPEGFFRLASDAKRASQRPTNLGFATQRGDGFGPGNATLARKVFKDHSDINLLDTWRMVNKAGEIVYESRLHSAPRGNDPQQQITATLVGWATYLRSRKIAPLIIDRRLASWGEPSTQRKANRAETVRYGANVKTGRSDSGEAGPGVIIEFQRKGERIEAGETWLYAGGERIGRLRFGLDELSGIAENTNFNTRGLLSDDDVLSNFVQTSDLDNVDNEDVSLEPGEVAALYAALKSEYTGSSGDLNTVLAFLEPRVYGTHGLTPVGTSPEEGFRLTEIMEHILRSYYPKLTWAGDENNFPVTQATWHDSPAHGYDIFQQLNNLVLWELSVWEERKVHFHAADLTRYDWQIRTDDANVKVDFQGDSIENFANGVSVTYTDFWGVKRVLYPPDHEELRDDSETNPANLHNENLWTDTEMPWPGTEAEALQFGRATLAKFNRPKRPGTYRVTGYIQDGAGGLHPAWRVRSSETLGIGDHPEDAPRLITATKWDQDSLTLTVTVDAPPRRLDAIVARHELARQARNLG